MMEWRDDPNEDWDIPDCPVMDRYECCDCGNEFWVEESPFDADIFGPVYCPFCGVEFENYVDVE